MVRRSSLMSKLMVLMLAFAVVFTYSVLPLNQSFAASKKPAKVTGVKAKAVSSSSIKVSWKKAGNAKKYEVYKSTKKSSGFKKAGTTKGKSYTAKKLKAGTKYYFKVMKYEQYISFIIMLLLLSGFLSTPLTIIRELVGRLFELSLSWMV